MYAHENFFFCSNPVLHLLLLISLDLTFVVLLFSFISLLSRTFLIFLSPNPLQFLENEFSSPLHHLFSPPVLKIALPPISYFIPFSSSASKSVVFFSMEKFMIWNLD